MEWKQNFIKDPKFDVHTMLVIMFKLEEQYHSVDHIVHLGNNVFEMTISEVEPDFLSGRGYSGVFRLENNKVVRDSVTSVWMS